jgi:hypothetical protein
VTARTKDSGRAFKAFRFVDLTLLSGTIAFKHARAAFNGAGKVVPATSSPLQQAIGQFVRKVDASAADKAVVVDLEREVVAYWYANHTGGDAVLATDVGRLCYALDDETVTITPTNRSVAGRVWAVSSTKGVLVETLALPDRLCRVPTSIAFVANDYVLTAAACLHDAVIDVPLTGAASTVTLPAAAPDGSRISFCADGTKNGHTVTYRDATGPTNLTTALTASKRHLVVCVKQAGAWFANAYVSP